MAIATATATTREPEATDSVHGPVYRCERILVAVDGSPQSLLALRRAEELAHRINARLDLLTSSVVPSTAYWGGAPNSAQLNDVYYAEVLREAADSVADDIPVTTYFARGNAAARILEHAEKYSCTLIVMGCRGRGRAAAALLGSTSHAVLHAAKVPVLVVRNDGASDPVGVAA